MIKRKPVKLGSLVFTLDAAATHYADLYGFAMAAPVIGGLVPAMRDLEQLRANGS